MHETKHTEEETEVRLNKMESTKGKGEEAYQTDVFKSRSRVQGRGRCIVRKIKPGEKTEI